MAPDWSFISTAVSTSLMPWPRVPNRPVSGSTKVRVPMPAMESRNPSAQLVGAAGAALGGPGGHLLALLIPKDGQFHFLAFQVLEYGLDLLNGADLGVVDVGDDVPPPGARRPGRERPVPGRW